jgi:hypothetical protein
MGNLKTVVEGDRNRDAVRAPRFPTQEVKQMRKWFKALLGTPRGFSADGQRLGLGLATALARQNDAKVDAVEEYLRKQPVADKVGV